MDNDKKIMLCALSLSRIAQDLKELSFHCGAVMCLALSQHLASRIQDIPEATVHNVETETIHDTGIGDEINNIVEKIQNEDV